MKLRGICPPVATGSGPRQGSNRHHRVLDPHEHLGGRADEAHAVHLQEVEVGGGVQAAEPPIQIEGGRLEGDPEPLTEHYLERVTGADVLADAFDPGLEVFSRRRLNDEFLTARSIAWRGPDGRTCC